MIPLLYQLSYAANAFRSKEIVEGSFSVRLAQRSFSGPLACGLVESALWHVCRKRQDLSRRIGPSGALGWALPCSKPIGGRQILSRGTSTNLWCAGFRLSILRT